MPRTWTLQLAQIPDREDMPATLDALRAAGGGLTYCRNYDRLVRIKLKYDPDNLFRLNRNVRPAQTLTGRRSGA